MAIKKAFFMLFSATCFVMILMPHHVMSAGWQQQLDPAIVYWTTNSNDSLAVELTNKECQKCMKTELIRFSRLLNASVKMETYMPSYYFSVIILRSKKEICTEFLANYITFGENASYLFQVNVNNETAICTLTELVAPAYPVYLPLYIFMSSVFGIIFIYFLLLFIYKR